MADPIVANAEWRARAEAGTLVLQQWFAWWTGQWRTTRWWNAANALTTLVRYMQCTGDRRYSRVIEQTFRAAGLWHPRFINRNFDDNAWWGLAWLEAYDLTGAERYSDAARVIFDDMTEGWDSTCRGGLWWNRDRRYKNAITNELFLSLAARLHKYGEREGSRYIDWALREWDWFSASGMIGPSGLVNDGLTADCRNNGEPAYTYNQGVILGGLSALYEITGQNQYLNAGEKIADAALLHLTSPASCQAPGILVEPGEEHMAVARRRGDGSQFKGIFIRNLHDFARHSGRPAYGDFIIRNADSIWHNSRNSRNQFGVRWTGPFDTADASRQSSALDALVAAAASA